MNTKTDNKEFVKEWMEENGEIKQKRMGYMYFTFDHDDWDSILAVPVGDDLFKSIRKFIENQEGCNQ